MRVFLWNSLIHGELVVPLCITFTYLLFIMVPSAVMVILLSLRHPSYEVALQVVYMLVYVNLIADAMVYVLCDRDIRTFLMDALSKKIATRNTV